VWYAERFRDQRNTNLKETNHFGGLDIDGKNKI
jgi:hypothetical protein